MRADMQRVIVNTARGGSRHAPTIKTRLRIRNLPVVVQPVMNFRLKEDEEYYYEPDDTCEWDEFDSPNRISRRHRHRNCWYVKSQNDRTNPLFRFLKSSVGKPWDKVWSEICSKTPVRSIVGKHLRDHVGFYVNIFDNEVRSYMHFFIDSRGILRERQEEKREEEVKGIVKIKISETHELRFRDGFWFEIRREKLEEKARVTEKFVGGKCYRFETPAVSYFSEISRRQVGSKELKVIHRVLEALRNKKRTELTSKLRLALQNTFA